MEGGYSRKDEDVLELRLGPPADWSPSKTPQKRRAPAVVGWPPVRSFRKNIASGSSKPAPDKMVESCQKGLFVKINMVGVAIGRKVDLNIYDSYEKLSVAVDQLFRGHVAAQTGDGINDDGDENGKAVSGLLNGNCEYTLVYEDNEGDRMLVGDVPWDMFVSSVKRLRVIKSSEISNICCVGSRHGGDSSLMP